MDAFHCCARVETLRAKVVLIKGDLGGGCIIGEQRRIDRLLSGRNTEVGEGIESLVRRLGRHD